MSAMQLFYTKLSRSLEVYNPHLEHLMQLTRISPAQAREIKTDKAWVEWPIATE